MQPVLQDAAGPATWSLRLAHTWLPACCYLLRVRCEWIRYSIAGVSTRAAAPARQQLLHVEMYRLALAYMGSCSPGNCLHFKSSSNCRDMYTKAFGC